MKAWDNAPPPQIKVPTALASQLSFDVTESGVVLRDPDGAHDPLSPDWEVPTPVELVMRLTRPQRERRVERLVEIAHARLAEAVEVLGAGKEVVAQAVLCSGGNDSMTVAHLFRDRMTHLIHANTGTGMEATRRFVRQVAADWQIPLIEECPSPGAGYRELVLGEVRTLDGLRQPYPGGFPGPSAHAVMYQRLKERALERAKHRLGISNSRTKRAVYIAGRRRAESKMRESIPHYEPWGTVIWSSPIAVWHKADLHAYRLMFDVPANPVAEVLGMSGECGCLANASPGEPARWRDAYPDDPFIREIDELEELLKERTDIPDHRKTWGWGGTHNDRDFKKQSEAGRLCGPDCGRDPLLDLMDPLWGDAA